MQGHKKETVKRLGRNTHKRSTDARFRTFGSIFFLSQYFVLKASGVWLQSYLLQDLSFFFTHCYLFLQPDKGMFSYLIHLHRKTLVSSSQVAVRFCSCVRCQDPSPQESKFPVLSFIHTTPVSLPCLLAIKGSEEVAKIRERFPRNEWKWRKYGSSSTREWSYQMREKSDEDQENSKDWQREMHFNCPLSRVTVTLFVPTVHVVVKFHHHKSMEWLIEDTCT